MTRTAGKPPLKWILMETWMNKSVKVHITTLAHTSLNSYGIYSLYKAITVRYFLLEYVLYILYFQLDFLYIYMPGVSSLLPEDENSALYFFVFLTVLSTEQALQNTTSLITDICIPCLEHSCLVAQKRQSVNLSTGKSSHNISYGGGKATPLPYSGQDNKKIWGFYLM